MVWLRMALADRDTQLDYIAQESIAAALEQGSSIAHQLDLLAELPEMGRVGRQIGTRELVVSRTPFIMVYRLNVQANRIELLRSLHGSQQWPL